MAAGADILAKALMPTTASSAEIRENVAAQIRARSLFSARTTSARYLAGVRRVLAEVAARDERVDVQSRAADEDGESSAREDVLHAGVRVLHIAGDAVVLRRLRDVEHVWGMPCISSGVALAVPTSMRR